MVIRSEMVFFTVSDGNPGRHRISYGLSGYASSVHALNPSHETHILANLSDMFVLLMTVI